MSTNEFSNFLKSLRLAKGLKVTTLAKQSGVSHSFLYQIESGKRGIPSPEVLNKLAAPLGITALELSLKAGHLPFTEFLPLWLNELTENDHIKDNEKQFISKLLIKHGIDTVDENSHVESIFNAIIQTGDIKKVDKIADELACRLSEIREDSQNDQNETPPEIQLEEVIKNTKGLTYNSTPLTQQNRKRIMDMLRVLFDDN